MKVSKEDERVDNIAIHLYKTLGKTGFSSVEGHSKPSALDNSVPSRVSTSSLIF